MVVQCFVLPMHAAGQWHAALACTYTKADCSCRRLLLASACIHYLCCAGVQVIMVMNATLWSRGWMAYPAVVPHTLKAMLTTLDRLAGLELCLSYGNSITGKYGGGAFAEVLFHLHKQVRLDVATGCVIKVTDCLEL